MTNKKENSTTYTDEDISFFKTTGGDYMTALIIKIGYFINEECKISETSAVAFICGGIVNALITHLDDNKVTCNPPTRNQHVAFHDIYRTFDIFDPVNSQFIDHMLANKEQVLRMVKEVKEMEENN